jgi:hypothetical protein
MNALDVRLGEVKRFSKEELLALIEKRFGIRDAFESKPAEEVLDAALTIEGFWYDDDGNPFPGKEGGK